MTNHQLHFKSFQKRLLVWQYGTIVFLILEDLKQVSESINQPCASPKSRVEFVCKEYGIPTLQPSDALQNSPKYPHRRRSRRQADRPCGGEGDGNLSVDVELLVCWSRIKFS
jgi:hypothetical protein